MVTQTLTMRLFLLCLVFSGLVKASNSDASFEEEGILSVQVPASLIDRFQEYCTSMSLFNIMESLSNDQVDEFSRQIKIKGFPFEFRQKESAIMITSGSEESAQDVVSALADAGLHSLLDGLPLFLNPQQGPVTFSAFANNEEFDSSMLRSSSPPFEGYRLLLPGLVSGEQLTLELTDRATKTTRSFAMTQSTGLLYSASKVEVRPAKEETEQGINFVLVMTLSKAESRVALKPLTAPLDQDFNSTILPAYEIAPVTWMRSGDVVSPGGYRIGLKPIVRTGILDYLNKHGFVDLLKKELFQVDYSAEFWRLKRHSFGPWEWFVQRDVKDSEELKNFSMIFMVPASEEAHDDFCKALSAAGFDEVIDAIGRKFGWDGAVMTHLSLLGLNWGIDDDMHSDFYETGGKGFNVLVPLILPDSDQKELFIYSPTDAAVLGRHKYAYDQGVMVGDHCEHATAGVDYRSIGQFRFFAGLYVGDVNEENKDTVTPSYYVDGFPFKDPEISMRNRGKHWNPHDASIKLPTW
jgi:hypothetical protein